MSKKIKELPIFNPSKYPFDSAFFPYSKPMIVKSKIIPIMVMVSVLFVYKKFARLQQVKIAIPAIEVQKSIADIFKVYNTRKRINEQLKAQIKDICPILIKGSIDEAR